jgi:hypothetical protein
MLPKKPKPKFGDGLIGPPERPGKKLRGAAKAAGGMLYDALETTANPAAPFWNRMVGPDSKLNTKNLTKRLLPGRLKDLVPTPRGKKKSPERKPQKSAPMKTWRDRMNSRRNLN